MTFNFEVGRMVGGSDAVLYFHTKQKLLFENFLTKRGRGVQNLIFSVASFINGPY